MRGLLAELRERPFWQWPFRRIAAVGFLIAALASAISMGYAAVGGEGAMGPRKDVPKGSDFVCFYAGGRLIWEDRIDELYVLRRYRQVIKDALDRPRTSYRPRYPPPIYTFIAPLTRWGFVPAVSVFSVVFYAVWALGGWVLLKGSLPATRQAPVRRHTYWGAVLSFMPLTYAILTGHPSSIFFVLFALAAGALYRGNRVLAGVFLGMVVYKPPLAVAVFAALAATLDVKLWLGAAIGACLMIGGNMAVVGPEAWGEWWESISRAPAAARTAEALQQHRYARDLDRLMRYPERMHTLRAALSLMAPKAEWGTARIAAFAMGALSITFAGSLWWRGAGRGLSAVLRLSALICALLVAAPHLYDYDVGLYFIPLAGLYELSWRASGARQKNALQWYCLAGVLVFPLCQLSKWVRVQWSVPFMLSTLILLAIWILRREATGSVDIDEDADLGAARAHAAGSGT